MKSRELKADSVKSLTRIKLILEAFKKQVKLIYVSYNGNTFRSETKQNKTKITIVLTFLQSTLPSSDAEEKYKRKQVSHFAHCSFQCVHVRAPSLDYKFHQRQNKQIQDAFYYLLFN